MLDNERFNDTLKEGLPPRERNADVPEHAGTSKIWMGGIIDVCALVALFWAAFDQQFNTMLLWAEDHTDRSLDALIWRGEIPAPWFLALNPLLIFVFTPLIVRLWAWQARRGSEWSSGGKMAFACVSLALANLVMVAAAASLR